MEKWIVFGLLAALFLGAANIPQSIAPTKTTGFEVIFFGGIASLIIGFIGWYFLAPTDVGFTRSESTGYLWSLLAGSFLAVGSTFIVLAYMNGGNPATLPALFNMNTVVAFIFSLIFVAGAREALFDAHGVFDTMRFIKICIGILLVVVGGSIVASSSQRPVDKKLTHTTPHAHQHIRI
jgi:hypothetical protein